MRVFLLIDSKFLQTDKNYISQLAINTCQLVFSVLSEKLIVEHEKVWSKNKDAKKQNISFQISSISVHEPGKYKYQGRFPRDIFQKRKKYHFLYHSSHQCLFTSKILAWLLKQVVFDSVLFNFPWLLKSALVRIGFCTKIFDYFVSWRSQNTRAMSWMKWKKCETGPLTKEASAAELIRWLFTDFSEPDR